MSLFKNAQTVAATAPKGRKPKAEEVTIKGVERYAALKAAMDSIEALMKVEEASIKAAMAKKFVEDGCNAKTKPTNFKATDGNATASCQIKIRSSASVLSVDEQKLCEDHKIPYEKRTITQEAFLINPKYTNDMALLAKVEEALGDVDLPEDFLQKQEEVVKPIMSEEGLNAMFTTSVELATQLLPVCSTLAIRASIEGNFWPILDELMNPESEEAKATAEKAAA